MLGRITPADIEQARERLAAHRAEILARQATEIQRLDSDEAQVDDLARLVEAFMGRFKAPPSVSVVPAATPREAGIRREPTSLQVSGFDRVVLPAARRLTPSGAVSIDFPR